MNERAKERKARALEKAEQDRIDTATGALLQSPDGRSFLWWLLDIGRLDTTPFTSNALTTAFACGEQNIGLQVKAQLITTDPEGFLNLLKEKAHDRHDDEHDDDD